MAKGKFDFDFPSNNELVTPDRKVTMAWAQLFTRWQWIVGSRKTWQNVLADRALGVTYQNGTGREITVNVRAMSTASASIQFTLSGGTILRGPVQNVIGQSAAACFQIPNGETYTVDVSTGTGTLSGWMEYR